MLRAGAVGAYGSINAFPAGGSGWRYDACIERPLSGSLSAYHEPCQGGVAPGWAHFVLREEFCRPGAELPASETTTYNPMKEKF
jgi:hypothetical protein